VVGRVDGDEKFSNDYRYVFVVIGNAEIRNELVHKLSILYTIPQLYIPQFMYLHPLS
jgi:glutaredoxin-related protein